MTTEENSLIYVYTNAKSASPSPFIGSPIRLISHLDMKSYNIVNGMPPAFPIGVENIELPTIEALLNKLKVPPGSLPKNVSDISNLAYWVLSRCNVVMLDLDDDSVMGVLPLAVIADLVGMPVFLLTHRHTVDPVVQSLVRTIVHHFDKSLVVSTILGLASFSSVKTPEQQTDGEPNNGDGQLQD